MTPNQVRARLIERGMSLAQFARDYGYEPRTVTQSVARWAGADSLPQGRAAFSVIRDLSLLLGTEIIKGVLDDTFASYAGEAKPNTGNAGGERGNG